MSRKKDKNKLIKTVIEVIIILIILVIGYTNPEFKETIGNVINAQTENEKTYNLSEIPEYEGKPYVTINNNKPNFTEKDYTTEIFENYSELDANEALEMIKNGLGHAVVVLTKNKETQENFKQSITKKKLYINRNPFEQNIRLINKDILL